MTRGDWKATPARSSVSALSSGLVRSVSCFARVILFSKNSISSECPRSHHSLRSSSPRSDRSENPSPSAWPSSVRRESLLLEMPPKRRDTLQRTWDLRKPVPGEENWPSSSRRNSLSVVRRRPKSTNSESIHLLLEASPVEANHSRVMVASWTRCEVRPCQITTDACHHRRHARGHQSKERTSLIV